MFPDWAKGILFLLVFMISGLVLVIIIDGLLSGAELTPLNNAIESVLVNVRTPLLTNFFLLIATLGSPFVLSSVAVLITALMILKKRYYDALFLIVALLVSVISLVVLKNTFQIARPNLGLVDVGGWSFPSGHSTIATAFFFMIVYTFLSRIKTLKGKTILISCSVAGAIFIYISRLYLGAHWTLDVLAGIALGLLSVSFTAIVFGFFIGDKRLLLNNIRQ